MYFWKYILAKKAGLSQQKCNMALYGLPVLPIAEAFEKTVTGNPISVSDALAEPAVSLKVFFEPKQDLHGYDHPWPAGGGKNLIVPIDGSFTNNAVSCVCSASAETVSLKGTATGSGGRYLKMTQDIVLPVGNYVLSNTAISGKSQASYIVNRTDDDSYISGFRFSLEEETSVYVGANVLTDKVYDEVVHLQIEAGNTATAWAPYSNICPISGYESVSVTRSGVNVWDEEWESGTINGKTGTASADPDRIRSKNYIPVLPSQSYYIKAPTAFNFAWYDANKVYISGVTSASPNYVRKSPANAKYLRIAIISTTYNNNISINYPATVTDYEPYVSPTTYTATFTQQGTVYGGTVDIVTGALTVTWAILSNPQNLHWITNSSQGMKCFQTDQGAVDKKEAYGTNYNWKCSRYSNDFIIAGTNKSEGIYIFNQGVVAIRDYRYWEHGGIPSEVAAFKASLADVTIAYELATPLTYQLTAQQVTMLLGDNYLETEDGEITITYMAGK